MNDASCKITLENYPENCHAIVTVGNAFVLSNHKQCVVSGETGSLATRCSFLSFVNS